MRLDTHHGGSSSAAPIEPAHESVPLAAAPPGFVVAPHVRRSSTAARRVALFFFIAGILAIFDSILLPAAQAQESTFITLGLLAIAVVLWLLPWLPERTLLVIVPLAFMVIGLFCHAGATPLVIYPIFFILLFIWVGLSLPPWTSLALTPHGYPDARHG